MTQESVDRSIEGLFERLCLYISPSTPLCKRCGGCGYLCNGIGEGVCTCPDCGQEVESKTAYAQLHTLVLAWIKKNKSN